MDLKRRVYLFITVGLTLTGLAECDWSGFVNNIEDNFDYVCDHSLAITGIASIFNNGQNDRQWEYQCGSGGCVANVTSSCTLQESINDFTTSVDFECPSGGYIAGFLSTFSDIHEDRVWQPYCCSWPNSILIDCDIPTLLWENNVENLLNWTTTDGRILTGLQSFYSFFNQDRRWRFKQCRLEGPLSSVMNLSYSFIDSSTVNISWSPPFTLSGTYITGYNISATSNGTTTNYFTPNSYYELSLTDITDSPCNEIIITISGYNGLDGENSTLTGIYLLTVPSYGIETVLYTLEEDLHLSLSINVSELCVGQYPSQIKVTLLNIMKSINLPKQLSTVQVLEVNNVTKLQQNIEYTVIITYSNQAGDFNFSNTIHFFTNDLVAVRILNSSDSRVCLECSFSSVFSTDNNAGCTVELVSSTNSTLTYTQSFPRSSDGSSIAIGCVYGINTGQYSITVHDTTNTVIAVTTSVIELCPVVPVIMTTSGTSLTDLVSSSVMITESAQSGRSYASVFVTGFFPGIITGVIIEGIVVVMIVLVYCRVKGKPTVKSSPLATTTDGNDIMLTTRK